MPEILTESFCERCGTRYTFESSAPRAKPLRGLKTLGKGLRNFVMSDDTSIDEAMAAARSEAERDVTTQQLDAFHSTFNFCMSCRQYTCSNCWNETEGQCLTCSPHLGHEILPAPFPDLDAHGPAMVASTNGVPETPVLEAPAAWPLANMDVADDVDVDEIDLGARLLALDMAAEVVDERAEPEAVEEPVEAVAADAVPDAGVADELAAAAAAVTIEEALEAYEREQAEQAAAEAADAGAGAEPEPVAAAQPAQDVIEQPVWLPVAPDPDAAPAAEAPAAEPGLAAAASAAPEWPAQPEWPSQPQWPSARSSAPRPNTILGRPVVPNGGIDALWAASSRDVLAPPLARAPLPLGQAVPAAAQPCVNCGLSLSSTARFCRRCGTAQAHP
jgi:hypothetical protein